MSSSWRSDYDKALEKLLREIMTVANHFRIFCAESAILMISKYKMMPKELETDFPALSYNKKLDVPFLFSEYK